MARGVKQIWQHIMKLTAIPVPVPGSEDKISEAQLPSFLIRASVAFFHVSDKQRNRMAPSYLVDHVGQFTLVHPLE